MKQLHKYLGIVDNLCDCYRCHHGHSICLVNSLSQDVDRKHDFPRMQILCLHCSSYSLTRTHKNTFLKDLLAAIIHIYSYKMNNGVSYDLDCINLDIQKTTVKSLIVTEHRTYFLDTYNKTIQDEKNFSLQQPFIIRMRNA